MCTGITLAIFSTDEKTPDEKDKLNISARWVEISFFHSFRILFGRLFGPVDLSLFSEDVIKFTSCVSAIAISNDSSLGWWRKSWNDFFLNLMLALVFSAIELKYSLKILAISIH